jgi:hypothetical protein
MMPVADRTVDPSRPACDERRRDPIRDARPAAVIRPASRSATKGIVPIAPLMPTEIKVFGRYKGGAIRDGVLVSIGDIDAAPARAA